MQGATAILQLGVGLLQLATDTIFDLIMLFVNIAILIALAPKLLRRLKVVRVGGADKIELIA